DLHKAAILAERDAQRESELRLVKVSTGEKTIGKRRFPKVEEGLKAPTTAGPANQLGCGGRLLCVHGHTCPSISNRHRPCRSRHTSQILVDLALANEPLHTGDALEPLAFEVVD